MDDLAALVKDNVSMDRLYGIAEEKANSLHASTKKELARINKELANRKAELILVFEARQDLAEQLHDSKKK